MCLDESAPSLQRWQSGEYLIDIYQPGEQLVVEPESGREQLDPTDSTFIPMVRIMVLYCEIVHHMIPSV